MSDPASLFEPVEGGGWQPTGFSRGPWDPGSLHGGPVAALLAREAEAAGAAASDVEWQAARLSVELLRPVPLAPLAVSAGVTRPGRKVQLIDAELRQVGGGVLATARLLRIRRTPEPTGAPVTTADQRPPAGPDGVPRATPTIGDVEAFHSHGAEHRFAAGMIGVPGPATDWIRLRVPVVPGEEPSPLQRVAAAADFGNGISGVASFGELLFINPDLTIHLHRLPAGEWVCLDAVTWMEDQGIALAESRLWDEHGPLGRSLQSLLIEAR